MTDSLALSGELLGVMHVAARKAVELGEPFISVRAVLLALLDDPGIGPAIGGAVNREKLLAVPAEEDFGVQRIYDEPSPDEDEPALVRYDTLAFKTPDGRSSVWLSRDALRIFMEGARRAQERYYPKQLALGLATIATRSPGTISAIAVEPGGLAEAIYRL